MKSNDNLTELETLERFRLALENAKQQTEIASSLAELGYDVAKMDEGNNLWQITRQTFDATKTEGDEKSAAYSVLSTLNNDLFVMYKKHRKKGKIVFGEDPLLLKRLLLTGIMPSSYVNRMETYRHFYIVLDGDVALQEKIAVLKVPAEEIQSANN